MRIRRIGAVYGLTGLGFTAIYLTLFHTPLFASQHVLFYRGIELLIISTIVSLFTGILVYWLLIHFSFESFIAALVMSVSVNLVLFVVFPVTFDRSVTMYLLNKLKSQNSKVKTEAQRSKVCEGATVDRLEKNIIDEYVKRDGAVNRRINEQSVIQTINENQDCVTLTDRGENFITWSEAIKKLYNIQ